MFIGVPLFEGLNKIGIYAGPQKEEEFTTELHGDYTESHGGRDKDFKNG